MDDNGTTSGTGSGRDGGTARAASCSLRELAIGALVAAPCILLIRATARWITGLMFEMDPWAWGRESVVALGTSFILFFGLAWWGRRQRRRTR